ncbi:protein kinase [Klebsiella pneumoniae]|nr:protein kinase [Klebsiella pneumoniae]MDS7060355.1 protein kinase [Klebsiella pneumoniae]MDS7154026.1 protein kinase [Klebsiella pneumoniae]MDS7233267.1 protein kinase [Klebsiella pneumoniae]MDS7453522.1 protein kinase [Klebsiella pneumoniae]
MNYTDMQERLDAIRNLPICELNKRQPLLVALMADIVNCETSDGDDTDSDWGLELQVYWQTLKIKAKDAGFNLLGNGHFSAAFKHELLPGRVIKVGFKKEDSGAAYVAFCRMHQGRVGIPNVYHVARHAGCYTVVLDELEPCKRHANETHEHYADLANYFVENSGAELGDVDGAEQELSFVETCQMIHKFFHGIASFDMHSGNIMFTKDGKPVITDPVSFSEDRDREPFSMEPEELLAEIEQIAHDKMIERCKRNKAKRDRDSTLCRARRANNKARRNRVKAAARWRKEREREREQYHVDALKLDLASIEERVLAWQMGPGLAIQMGKPLPIDNYLQGRLMG